jgi:hypothetical protein
VRWFRVASATYRTQDGQLGHLQGILNGRLVWVIGALPEQGRAVGHYATEFRYRMRMRMRMRMRRSVVRLRDSKGGELCHSGVVVLEGVGGGV